MSAPFSVIPYPELRLSKKADAIEARYHKANEYIDKITQSILAKAFRGELVPQDPSDVDFSQPDRVPASVLLERIRQEKAEKEKKTKTKPKKTSRKKTTK